MNNPIHTHLEHITDAVSRNHDGLRTLAALLAYVGNHSDHLQRQDELALGLSALVGAIAEQCQASLETLCTVNSEAAAMAQRTAHLEAELYRRERMPLSTPEGMAAHVAIVFGPNLAADSSESSATAPQ